MRGVWADVNDRWHSACLVCGRDHIRRVRQSVKKAARGVPFPAVCSRCPLPASAGATLVAVQCTACKLFEERPIEPEMKPSLCASCVSAARAALVIQAAERLRVARNLADLRSTRAEVEEERRELRMEMARAKAVISLLRSENSYYELNFSIMHARVVALEELTKPSWAQQCAYASEWPSLEEKPRANQVRVLTRQPPNHARAPRPASLPEEAC